MITIKITTKTSPLLNALSDKVWEIVDKEHYGRKINWKKETRFIHAYKNNKLVGMLELTMEAGVMHILDLVVDYKYHKQDIGTTLMKKAEMLAVKKQMHKIFLETGKNWNVRKFYKKLGYIKTGSLPKHFAQQDYVEYTKFID